jgi:hypothetical protein
MGWDLDRRVVVVFGGLGRARGDVYQDTWELGD